MSRERASIPPLFHALAAAFVSGCVWLALRRPETYAAAMQEDRAVEWATVLFFAAAGVVGGLRAVRERRAFDGLVALFCLFVAGEEMSWGQRLLGVTPPAYFLENNTQQELNVHNFGAVFGSPKWPFMVVLFAYSVLLPAVALTGVGRRLLARIGATPPATPVIPWFVAAIVLFWWYPVKFTGEWVELLAGAAFFAANGIPQAKMLASAALAGALAWTLAAWSSRGDRDPARIVCATAEVRAIAAGLENGADADLSDVGSLHKRVWTMADDGYVSFDSLARHLDSVRCADGDDSRTRRRFAVDPWGTAYWVRVANADGKRSATVYSFGPNRRRDMATSSAHIGDDVVAHTRLSAR